MTSMALWHLELLPGQKYPVMVTRDFRITNAALGEEIVDESGRSVVKITHQPVNPRDLADDSDSDSDFSDDEDEDEEDEEVDMEKLMAAVNGKKGKKASAEEEEVDDDEEDDEDFEEDPVATAVVCSLLPGRIEQTQLNLIFVSEEVVMFEVTGKNPVHLMGNYIHQETGDHHHHGEDYEESDDEDFSFEEDSDDEDVSMTEDASHRFEEVKEEAKAKKADATKKRKAETQETDSKRSTASAAEKKAPTPVAAEKKAEQPAKKQKTEVAKPAEKKKEAAEKPEQKSSKKQTLASGLQIEDFKVGDGPVAKKGKRVGMRYIGKLLNGKVFDSNTSGQPFYFRLGAGEVIKGWDQGIEGMAVGGERKLTIPAKLAYGSQKLPGLPPNSVLTFDCKLVNVK
ncbi:hypothetical protein QFC24_002773 [Naganishia onofrii]|uniref:Uncharacterized protein n=1 Tax=Naganishia onofrii TaxID=1851511 RepID=A0ACC2XNA7_9TREE|nr:hypothetical protein QFC24_002773 [Naganishia onofrii]